VRERSVHERAAEPGELAQSFVVTVSVDDAGAAARVDFVDPDGVPITRSVRGATCDEVVSGIALVTALAIDARAVTEVTPPAPPASAPPPPPATKPPPPPPPAPPPPSPAKVEPRFAAGLGAGWVSNAGPSGALAFDAFFVAGIGARGPSARLSAFHWRAELSGPTGQAGRLRYYGGRLEGCPLLVELAPPLFFEPCLGADLAALVSSGVESSELPVTDGDTQFYADAILLGRLGLALGAMALLEVQAGATVPFTWPSFGFDEQSVFEVPRVGASVRGGVGIRFP